MDTLARSGSVGAAALVLYAAGAAGSVGALCQGHRGPQPGAVPGAGTAFRQRSAHADVRLWHRTLCAPSPDDHAGIGAPAPGDGTAPCPREPFTGSPHENAVFSGHSPVQQGQVHRGHRPLGPGPDPAAARDHRDRRRLDRWQRGAGRKDLRSAGAAREASQRGRLGGAQPRHRHGRGRLGRVPGCR